MPTVELWYIDLSVNNHNSRVYLDLINDIRATKNGPFSCTMKLNNGIVVDYAIYESSVYADPKPTKTDQMDRR